MHVLCFGGCLFPGVYDVLHSIYYDLLYYILGVGVYFVLVVCFYIVN